MSITIKNSGKFTVATKWMSNLKSLAIPNILKRFGDQGVRALRKHTPIDSSETANSWYYEIENSAGSYKISWNNRHINDGVPIAVILQYGHGTRNGGYVVGRDYINPALKHILDDIAEEAWKEVQRL